MIQLTPDEMEVLDMTVELVNAFAKLPDKHPSDMQEFVHNIHAIQNQIMARPTRRWVNRDD